MLGAGVTGNWELPVAGGGYKIELLRKAVSALNHWAICPASLVIFSMHPFPPNCYNHFEVPKLLRTLLF